MWTSAKLTYEAANLQGCDLVQCDFRFASLRRANLGPSNLGGPSAIAGCDFSGSDLTDAVFDSVIYDEETTFPQGFDPTQHRMIRKEDWDPESYTRELKERIRRV
jgi:uncharacterized protein YjbI with pentapeptide repeats